MDQADLPTLLQAILDQTHDGEVEWVEFKRNNSRPEDIGEYVSALANSAALHRRDAGYLVWGVDNSTHAVEGTTFRYRAEKVGNQELEGWLHTLLFPAADFQFHEFEFDGKPVVLLRIFPANSSPIRFKETEYIRIGSNKKKLKDFPEKEKSLWRLFSEATFEDVVARDGVTSDNVLNALDYPAYFTLTMQPLPDNRAGILQKLAAERFITAKAGGRYDITNLGAVLFARQLTDFGRLARKAMRVILYRGDSRVQTVREQAGVKGYAAGFEGLIRYINDQVPKNEHIGQALRAEVPMFPELAVRELVANALIHQDFALTGTGPKVEIFSDRMEITNPGHPLIDPLRFIDGPPRSRNETVAAFMRRANICEERGSGIDKVVHQAEFYQLPAPKFVVTVDHIQAVLFAPQKLADMDRDDKVRACYQHACLRYVSKKPMTNTSLRERFAIDERNYSIASRIISDTVKAGLIRPADLNNRSTRLAKYVPFWS